ncbi:hypothetical protein, partial [Candidatus Binatus sp.]|uniref:hypothetical protein n=1 Tax=Candidatus Binatus sp. TaxID=2811406 RepID=UPI003C926998
SRTIRTRSDTVIRPVRWPRKERLSCPAIARLAYQNELPVTYKARQMSFSILEKTDFFAAGLYREGPP